MVKTHNVRKHKSVMTQMLFQEHTKESMQLQQDKLTVNSKQIKIFEIIIHKRNIVKLSYLYITHVKVNRKMYFKMQLHHNFIAVLRY